MKLNVILLFLSCITCIYCLKWEDCGVPLTRKIYFQNVVLSPSNINIAAQSSDRYINLNVAANVQNYELGADSSVSLNIQLYKEDNLYVDSPIGDLCTILARENNVKCPLSEGAYSFIYKYQLPPLPTGNYTLRLTLIEDSSAKQIGCLLASTQVIGLGADACSYSSGFSAVFSGKSYFENDNTVIQVGPRGMTGIDTTYEWGTFKSITASPDLVGYNFQSDHYVWGLSGNLTATNTFSGIVYIGYLPDLNNYENAQLVYQGSFMWTMTPTDDSLAYVFSQGTFSFVPPYFYPDNFPYPLNLGNLGNLTLSMSSDKSYYTVTSGKRWCRCNCILGGSGNDNLLQEDTNKGTTMSTFKKATIGVAAIGSFLIVVAILLIIVLRRSRPRPVVYDEADLMDPQKPDYGTMAINEAFEAENQEYN